MSYSENGLTYATLCGSLLDDMLDKVIHNIVSKSLLQEKLLRQEYGSIKEPIFHDPPYFDDPGHLNVTLIKDSDDSDDSDIREETGKEEKKTMNGKKPDKTLQFKEPDIGRFQFQINGKDVYVNALNDNRKLLGEKANLLVVGTAQDTYFQCSNCDRKIAGSRFGAHVDKCYGGRSRK